MDATVTLDRRMTFTAKADSGFSVTLDADPAVGGDDSGFRPMELMLLSLAGCTAMDVISILRKKRQKVTDFQVKVHAEQADEHPKVFTDIKVTYIVHGTDVDPEAVRRSIELSETKYCPAQAMLVQATPITHTFEIVEVDASASTA
ncbi:MAG: OsmC family protein [Candidatus Promineifilaceae bacterium]|nr:OsmC family protein [Candidatus Promineifilaceae bacterium]